MASMNQLRILNFVETRWLWHRVSSLTMVSRKRFVDNLLLMKYYLQRLSGAPGCYVECGTWAGGMSFAAMRALPEIKEWHFFDSFEGLPQATAIDGSRAVERQRKGEMLHDNNTADYTAFKANLERFGRPDQSASIHKGWFEDTLPGFRPKAPISVLRMDGDWYDSTMTILENLFDQVTVGGLIIIDDYYDYEGCSRAIHDFLSKRRSLQKIYRSAHGVAYIVKHREDEVSASE